MTAIEAREYAARIYDGLIEPVSVMSDKTAALVKELLADAYMDGGLAVARSLDFSKLGGSSGPVKSYEDPQDHAHIQELQGDLLRAVSEDSMTMEASMRILFPDEAQEIYNLDKNWSGHKLPD
jgi:hypothetical protein